MKSKCSPSQALVKLNRRRLLEVAEAAAVDLPPKSRKKEMLQVFEGLTCEGFKTVLEQLTPVELRQLCRAALLDDSGMEGRLRDRLLGREQPIATAAPPGASVVASE